MGVWVSTLMILSISLSKPSIISEMIKSAFQLPDHVAIRFFVHAPPRRKLSLNFGAGGDGFPHSAVKG
jgi:hypothetical protein